MIRRSITLKIVAWCVAALLLSLAGFVIVSTINIRRITPFFIRVNALQRDDAIRAYETGGLDGLTGYFHRLQQYIPAEYSLTDSHGKDLATGDDRASVLRADTHRQENKFIIVSRSTDQRYGFIVVVPAQGSIRGFLPFYLLVPLAVGLLVWAVAINIASPLRQMTRIVDRFGRGDLSSRINSTRPDEIGGVARAFDQMADRIQTLLTAERRLLQDVSHELRSPLTRIAFAAALTRTDEDRDASAARLQKEISRLVELVNELLQVTRAEGDTSARVMHDVSLPDLLRDVIGDCQVEAAVRGCEIKLICPAQAPMRGDYELLRRAVENVIRNAARYAPRDSVIEATLDMASETATISVRDLGPGVPEDALPKLFQPFFRVDPARDGATGGTGLGLSIAYRAVAVHGGTITAKNADPGLLVTICLPVPSSGPEELVRPRAERPVV